MLMEIVGWTGSFLIVLMYALNSYQKIKSNSPVFYAVNITGGILLVIFSLHKETYPFVLINAVWILIAVPPLLKTLAKKE